MDWNVSAIFQVISLYRQFPCLWDYKSPEYKRTDLKKNAWEEIAKHMQKDVEEVKKKIKNLRSAYVSEKNKIKTSKPSGSGADGIYRPHLFYYEEFSFLDSVVVLRKTHSNIPKNEVIELSPDSFLIEECQDLESSFCEAPLGKENSLSSSNSETPLSSKDLKSIKRARMNREEKFSNALDAIIKNASGCNEHESMFSSFGKSIAIQLAQLPLIQATSTMAEIQKLLALEMQKKDDANLF